MQYFTADTHFFHAQLLGQNDFAPRPFTNLDQFHQAVIQAWQARITAKDTVFHLGDIAMHPGAYPSDSEILTILEQLPGQIVFGRLQEIT